MTEIEYALQEQYSGDLVVLDSWHFDGWASSVEKGAACFFSSAADAAETLDDLIRGGFVGGSTIVVTFVREVDPDDVGL